MWCYDKDSSSITSPIVKMMLERGVGRMGKQEHVVYREVQRPRQIWVWIMVIGITIMTWYGFIQQIFLDTPFGDQPAPNGVLIVLWLLFGVVFPVLFLGIMKLIIEVREDGLYIRFIPFHFQYKQYLFKDIQYCESIIYSPLKRFGGWGISFNTKGEVVYNMSGNQGIELNLRNKNIVIGTRRPDELIKAITSTQQCKKC